MRPLSKDLQEFIRFLNAEKVDWVFFLSRDLLIRNKKASARDKDLGDVAILEKTRPGG